MRCHADRSAERSSITSATLTFTGWHHGPCGLRDRLAERLGSDPDAGGFGAPPCRQIWDTVGALVEPCVGGGFAFEGGVFEPGRVPAFALAELGDLHLQLAAHLGGAFGEVLDQLGRYTGDIRLTVDDLTEGDPLAVGELGTQHRLMLCTWCAPGNDEGPVEAQPFRV